MFASAEFQHAKFNYFLDHQVLSLGWWDPVTGLKMMRINDQIILEEDYDENYCPTEEGEYTNRFRADSRFAPSQWDTALTL